MATTTTNYGLTKPATTDNYDIAVPNANMDIIDTQMKATADGVTAITGGTTAAAKADKLTTARAISATGDATGSTSFDGSANASMALTLAASGATAGTYKSVTVDAKGRVTAGTNPTTAAGYGITDAVVKVASCSNTAITTTSQTTVLTYTPSAQGNFNINTYVRDVTAATTIDVELTYTDNGGSQTVEIFNGSAPVGSNMLPSYFFNATAAAITLKITAGTANHVYVSAALEE